MTSKLELVWNNLVSHVKILAQNNHSIIVKETIYNEFENTVHNMYFDLLKKAMGQNVKYLDRHKVAAIIIVALIDIRVIECREDESESSMRLLYQTAFSSGLSYMLYELNHDRLSNGKDAISQYVFPHQMFGDDSYCENAVKMLCFSRDNLDGSILLLANILFLIEAYTLVVLD